jgi:hypothetical protein
MKARTVFSHLLFATLLLFAAPIALARVVLYVDGVYGSDSNNCQTKQTACKTIGHAISLASPGYVISVAPATYPENLTINFDLGIIGSGASTTIIDGGRLNTVVTIPNNSSIVVLARLKILDGSGSYGYGGGIANYGIVTIVDSIITQNIAEFGTGESDGGGILNGGTLTLNRSTVSQNQITGDYDSYGGGIYNTGDLTINDSTVSGNSMDTADAYGAGIYNDGTLALTNATITGNSTESCQFYGGGVYNDTSGTTTIGNSTLTSNCGGGLVSRQTILMQNSILASNVSGNCEGTIISNGYNVSDDTSCNLTGPGDLNDTQPLLGPLQNNGGPTQTIGELLGSPTVDAGNPAGCTDGNGHPLTTDQRGAPRPGKYKHDKRCDMGAFERQTD